MKQYITVRLLKHLSSTEDLPAVREAVDVANIDDVREAYRDKMKKKLYGLLREREKNGEWKKFLDSILIELMGYEDCNKTIDYYTLYYKLSACRYLSFEYISQGLEAQVGETRRFARNGIGRLLFAFARLPFFPANHDRRAAQEVACGNDAILRQDEHGARSLDFLIHAVNAVNKGVAHVDEQCY